jgi:hypothetical protein
VTLYSLIQCYQCSTWLYGVTFQKTVIYNVGGSQSSGYEEFYLLGYITLCSLLKFIQHFGGTCGLHLQDRKISQTRNQREVQLCFLTAWLILWSWKWRWHVSLKYWLTFNRLHSYIPEDKPLDIHIFSPLKTFIIIISKWCHILNMAWNHVPCKITVALILSF